ncbi:MAG TPA: NAD-binding protein [Acidimicrobiia bacterium]|nr:NAD-binding protein [Acidimicrobiia bacterium]
MAGILSVSIFKRLAWHVRRVRKQFGGRVFRPLLMALIVVVFLSAVGITLAEKGVTYRSFGKSLYWSITTVLGQGDSSYATGPWGWMISWLLALFGVAMLATVTGAIVGFVIDFLMKEGQGMGAATFKGHIVVCGWNPTARELVSEFQSDDYKVDVVLVHDVERNPAGDGVYFVRGDATSTDDLERAGIKSAGAAVICPADASNEADMRSILVVLAIESIAPTVRTVVEVNNPAHLEHFRRADVDEVLVTSRLASRLLARTAMYPGLGELVTDIVSGGEGSELYRIVLPDEYVGLTIDALSARLRSHHQATLLGVARNGKTHTNPRSDFILERGDHAVVVAESLGRLSPLESGGLKR